MAYVIAEPCIGTKDTACVDAGDALFLSCRLIKINRGPASWQERFQVEGPVGFVLRLSKHRSCSSFTRLALVTTLTAVCR